MPLKAVVCWPLTQHCCEGQVLLMLMLLLPFFSLITAFLQSMFVCSWSWLGLKLCSSRLSRAAESLMKSTNTHFFLAIITSKFTQMETFPPLKKVVIKMHHLSIIGRSKLAGNVQRLPITSGLGFFFFSKSSLWVSGSECELYTQALQAVALPGASNNSQETRVSQIINPHFGLKSLEKTIDTLGIFKKKKSNKGLVF